MPGISIIIPCFNQSQYLEAAIESVLLQQLNDFEIIIIDDGSTDATPEFYAELGRNKQVILCQQSNQGAASARNVGIGKACKEYIAFLDADDLWLPEKLDHQIQALQHHNAEMVFTHIEQFISPELMNEALQNKPIKNKIMPGICPSTMLIQRQVFSKTGLFNEQLKLGEFIAWYLKARAVKINEYMLENILVHRRIHKNNTSYRNHAHRHDYLAILHQRTVEEVGQET